MKKFLAVLALAAFGALPVRADTMNFVTVLSSPVGTFNRVEEVDSQNAVTAPVINFCTGRGSGIVQLNGRGNPAAAKVNLERGAVLGGNAAEYRLPTLTMQAGGTLKGSRLLANTVNANNVPTLVKSSDIYASALNVQGAKTKKLNVGNGKSQITQAHEAEKMVWSNEHQQDKNGANSTLYAKQFLLKSEGTEGFDHIGDILPPVEKTYQWVLTDLGEQGMCPVSWTPGCATSCMSAALTTIPFPQEDQYGNEYYTSLPPETRAADSFIPNCSASQAGTVCSTGTLRIQLSSQNYQHCYCPKYTCKAL